jgi:hypothetical protein
VHDESEHAVVAGLSRIVVCGWPGFFVYMFSLTGLLVIGFKLLQWIRNEHPSLTHRETAMAKKKPPDLQAAEPQAAEPQEGWFNPQDWLEHRIQKAEDRGDATALAGLARTLADYVTGSDMLEAFRAEMARAGYLDKRPARKKE